MCVYRMSLVGTLCHAKVTLYTVIRGSLNGEVCVGVDPVLVSPNVFK